MIGKILGGLQYALMLMIIALIIFVGVEGGKKKPEKHRRVNVEETIITRVDTVYTSPPNAIKLDFGSIDTSWKGNDPGVVMLTRKINPSADFQLLIVCIDGYQYYVASKEASFSPRVMNGPNGMIAVPCKL